MSLKEEHRSCSTTSSYLSTQSQFGIALDGIPVPNPMLVHANKQLRVIHSTPLHGPLHRLGGHDQTIPGEGGWCIRVVRSEWAQTHFFRALAVEGRHALSCSNSACLLRRGSTLRVTPPREITAAVPFAPDRWEDCLAARQASLRDLASDLRSCKERSCSSASKAMASILCGGQCCVHAHAAHTHSAHTCSMARETFDSSEQTCSRCSPVQ